MKPIYEQPMLCPLEPNYLCPLSVQKIKTQPGEETEAAVTEKDVVISQLPQEINQIMGMINRDLSDYYDQLQSYGVPRSISQWLFLSLVTYVFRNAEDSTGSGEQRAAQLLRGIRRDAALLFNVLRGYGLPGDLIDNIFIEVIRIILRLIGREPGPGPGPGPRPTPGWSDWEDLGGVLTSAPAVASWQANRLDVFGRGQNQALWHKWWDGSRWSQWEDLGGGPITSGPAAASTSANRLEIFARGQRNQLLFRTWNGDRWSAWESLGGVITSEPSAVSWGGRRLDVFARGQNNHLWHIWRS